MEAIRFAKLCRGASIAGPATIPEGAALPDSDPLPDDDRRAFPRFSATLRARVATEDAEPVEATTINLSENGVLVSGEQLPLGGRVRIELELGDAGWQVVEADVVRAEGDHAGPWALAAEFADVATTGGREAVRSFLQERFG